MTELSNPEVVVAISSVISIICATIGSFYVSRLAARKDTIKELHDKITAQEVIIKQQNENYDKLYARLLQERDQAIKDRESLEDEIDHLKTEIKELRESKKDKDT
jgi:uncharacterized coiled-coil protein SlyX